MTDDVTSANVSGMEVLISQEYERLKALFADVDEKQLQLCDGQLWEAARLRAELEHLHEIAKVSGLIKCHPENPTIQKELPVSRMLPKIRANYTNIIFKLSRILGTNFEDEDLGFDEYI